MQIDFLGLQAFLAIVEHGSFAQAAVHLSLSQTAVSHRLRKLEEYLGQRLIARTTRSITLTDAGRELLPKASAAVGELGASLMTLRARGASRQPSLALACLPTLAACQLAPAFERFVSEHPDVDVRVYDVTISEIVELVASGTAEFGLTVHVDSGRDLITETLGDEQFVVVCPAGHAFEAMEAVPWRELAGQALIRIGLPVGNGPTIDEIVFSLGLHLAWRYEVQRTALALELVRAGMGVSIVPRLAVGGDAGMVVRPLVEPVAARRLQVVMRRDAPLTSPAAAFLCIVKERLRAALAAHGETMRDESGS